MGTVTQPETWPRVGGASLELERADRTVLVVDDDANVRGLIELLLGRAGYQVLAASDAAPAQVLLHTCATDLVIADLLLRDIDGFMFLRQLKADPATRALPVLVVTAYTDAEWRVRSAELGAAGFLGKPFCGRDLVAEVDRILAGA